MITTTNTITYNGNDLTAVSGLTVLASNPYAPAKRNLTINDIARISKAKVNSAFFNKRTVTVRMGITRATRDLVENSLDSLLSLLVGREKDLVLRQAGGLRRFTATYSDMIFRVEGGSYLEFDVVFETSDHFGYDQSNTLLLQVSGYTSANKTDAISVAGSAEWQATVITYTLTAVSGSTSKAVRFGNDANGQIITVTRTWTAGDVLEIDSLNQTVKVNGAEVAFTGAFPEWNIGAGFLTYSDTFTTSRTVSYGVTYKKRYI